MPGKRKRFNFGMWLREWDKLLKLTTWVLGVIGGFWVTPPGSSEASKSLVNLSRFIVVVLVASVVVAAQGLQKHWHSKPWLATAVLSLLVFIGGWFANDWLQTMWICPFKDGRQFVMGYKFTPNGDLLRQRIRCQTCEELIHNCGNERLESIWEPYSIDRNRRLLIAAYFVMLPVLVLCITSTVQAVVCSKQADPRRLYIPGDWQGELHPNGEIVLRTLLGTDRRGVGGTFSRSPVGAREASQNLTTLIEGSYFRSQYLYFAVNNRNRLQRYRMSLADSSTTKATLDALDERDGYVFLCGLSRIKKGQKPELSTPRGAC